MSEIEEIVGKKAVLKRLKRLDEQLEEVLELLREKDELPELSEKENMLLWRAVYDAYNYIHNKYVRAQGIFPEREEEE